MLVVAAQILIEDRIPGVLAYSGGSIACRDLFQKNYSQQKLKCCND
ncbi:MAG: hypothetical protein HC769_11050 [Cyanobacteria bacterium CRU_2_1]|nr:hypothetical protein [Cyanobacteria bacterium RU_5_0]NJR59332.1 hypothetical protein [Cyanobacteria bacterium CRU_2_1]